MKKAIISIFIALGVLLTMVLFVAYYAYVNINTYAVYYAKHIPHLETIDPEVIAVVEHLEWIEKPELEGVEYKNKGHALISFYDESNNAYFRFTSGRGIVGYRYSNKEGFNYYLDSETMELMRVYQGTEKSIPPEDFNEKQLKSEIHEYLQPIIDTQPEPRTNLQWLFDKVYHERYN